MKEKSIWVDTVTLPSYPTLEKDISTDVLIIGGGLAGILCAYELKKRNIDCVILEAETIGMGITKNTTAFITAQHEILYQDLIKDKGIKKAKQYLDLNLQAVSKYQELGKIYNIDYEECPSVLYSVNQDLILKEKEALAALAFNAEITTDIPFNDNVYGIKFLNQGCLHPLKLIKALISDLKIYEHTMVKQLKKYFAATDNNSITFNKVIITTHFPFINRTGLYFMKMKQRRSYVVAFPYHKINGTYQSLDHDHLYFRNHQDYLIVGGADRDTGTTYLDFTKRVKQLFPNVEIEYKWSNQDCTTLDEVPYIGKYDILHPNWYVVTGFNLWGFTWSMAASTIIADMIEHKKGFKVISPQRNFINKQLFKNLGNTLKNFITFRKPRCPHMGCALIYNKEEKTWECPCHGSRFDKSGNLIDSPALKNLSTK